MKNNWWLYLLNTSYLNNHKKLCSSPTNTVIITASEMQYSLLFIFVCTMGSSAVFLGYHWFEIKLFKICFILNYESKMSCRFGATWCDINYEFNSKVNYPFKPPLYTLIKQSHAHTQIIVEANKYTQNNIVYSHRTTVKLQMRMLESPCFNMLMFKCQQWPLNLLKSMNKERRRF